VPSLRWLIFDLDGCLVDSRGPIAHCMNHALEQLGLALEPETQLHRWIGPPLETAFRALLRARGADPASAPECIRHYRARYQSVSLAETRPFPGIAEMLRELGRRRILAVATSKPEAFSRPILAHLGLLQHFAYLAAPPLADTHREGKRSTVARAVQALGAAPGATAMIGDRHFDMRAARDNGLLAVGVTWGIGGERELRQAGAQHLVESAEELRALLGVPASGSGAAR